MKQAKALMMAINQKPIALYPAYIKITGDHATACVLSQLLHWHGAVGGVEFYKTNAELMEECILTTEQMKRVKRGLKRLTFVKIKAKGNPCRTFYDIDYDILADCLADIGKNQVKHSNSNPPTGRCQNPPSSRCQNPPSSRCQNPPSSRCQNPPSSRCQNPPTSRCETTPTILTENTTENTTEIKTNKKILLSGFEDFYQSYPKHVGKKDAEKAWVKIKEADRLLIPAAIANQKQNNPQWVKGDKQYIKAPAAWLNKECWCDQFDALPTAATGVPKLMVKARGALRAVDNVFGTGLNTLSPHEMEGYSHAAIDNQ